MTKLDRLIAKLCPNGVEYKLLGETGEFVRGSGLQKKDFRENGVGCIHYGQIYTYYGIFADKTKSFVSPQLAKTLKKVQSGDLIIASTSENVEDVCKTVAWLGTDEIVTGGHSTIFKHNQNPKYLAYYFTSQEFFDAKCKYARGTKVIDISAKHLAKIRVPIPPLPIQDEVVRILDEFTVLETELEVQLTAELEARKKQYTFYSDRLLTFYDDVELHDMADICTFSQGIQVAVDDQFQNKKNGFIRFLRIVDFVKDDESPRYIENPGSQYIKDDGDLIMIRYGASAAGRVFLKYSGAIANNMFQIRIKSKNITKEFLYHYLKQNKVYNYLNTGGGTSTMPAITFGQLGALKIPIPSIEEQSRIVLIIEKFDALIDDINSGLPSEIAARRKQYEYYRDKLLTFKEIA